jgi:tRNA nucleotidyltransferase/poly(A) polymerase
MLKDLILRIRIMRATRLADYYEHVAHHHTHSTIGDMAGRLATKYRLRAARLIDEVTV